MSDFELMPPEMPGEKAQSKKSGFFRKFFLKDRIPQKESAPTPKNSPIEQAPRNDVVHNDLTHNDLTHNDSTIAIPESSKMDIEEIKRKLGLDDEAIPAPSKMPVSQNDTTQDLIIQDVSQTTKTVNVNDWEADNSITQTTSVSQNVSQDTSQNMSQMVTNTNSTTPTDYTTGSIQPKKNKTAEKTEKIDDGFLVDAAVAKWDDENNVIGEHSTWAVDDDSPVPVPKSTGHHEIIDEHLAKIDQAHQEIMKKIDEAKSTVELPEWHMQEKEVLPEQYFFLKNGQPVRSVAELISALDYIDDSTFYHHVNEYRNDFAQWVRDVIGDQTLADSLSNATTKPSMLRELLSHRSSAAKDLESGTAKITQSLKKRKRVVEQLAGVEDQIEQVRRQLLVKTKELQGERHRNAKLLKEKLDAEIKKRLSGEQKALFDARRELTKAKQMYLAKDKEYESMIKEVSDKEKQAIIMHSKAQEQTRSAKEELKCLAEKKLELQKLVQHANAAKKQLDELRILDVETKKKYSEIEDKEKSMTRKEETLRQREKKITDDLTKAKQEQETLLKLRSEHEKREQSMKTEEAESKKHREESEKRISRAIEVERDTKMRLRAETQKLELLRRNIEKILAKATGEKKKITNAITLRKQLEESLKTVKSEVTQEREKLENEGFESYIKTRDMVTPAGQIDMPLQNDESLATKTCHPIYKKIEECRLAIERNDMPAAKTFYNQLREDYSQAKVSNEERSAMYTAIRELYDDIHLAMLS